MKTAHVCGFEGGDEMPKRMENGKEIEVNNADIIALQRVFYVMQDVCTTEERRQWEEDRLFAITQRLTRMGGGSGGVPGGIDAGLSAIEEAETKHMAKLMEYSRELERAEEILCSISNPNMRTFVILLYVHQLPGEEVRKRLNMTDYGYKRARKKIEQAQDMASAEWNDKYVLAKNLDTPSKNT